MFLLSLHPTSLVFSSSPRPLLFSPLMPTEWREVATDYPTPSCHRYGGVGVGNRGGVVESWGHYKNVEGVVLID